MWRIWIYNKSKQKNTKHKEIRKLTAKENKIYSKRIKIEHANNTLKTFRRLNVDMTEILIHL
jgi:hypothetical protein